MCSVILSGIMFSQRGCQRSRLQTSLSRLSFNFGLPSPFLGRHHLSSEGTAAHADDAHAARQMSPLFQMIPQFSENTYYHLSEDASLPEDTTAS